MKSLVHTQLLARLADGLPKPVHDAVQTSVLPDGNQTTDADVSRRADDEDRVVVTRTGISVTVTSCGLSHPGCWS